MAPENFNEKLYLSDKSVASLLDVCKDQVWKCFRDGRLPPPIKLGSMTRWRRNDIISWIESRQEGEEA